MFIKNKIEKTFSGPPIFVGYLFIAFGLLAIYNERFSTYSFIVGIPILLIACFVSFTLTGVEIDTEKRRIKQYTKIFGIIKVGKWKSLDLFLGVTLVPIKKTYGMASMSNRRTTSVKKDYRIYLVNKAKKPAFAIKTCKTINEAQKSLDEFAIWLKLPVYSVVKKD